MTEGFLSAPTDGKENYDFTWKEYNEEIDFIGNVNGPFTLLDSKQVINF